MVADPCSNSGFGCRDRIGGPRRRTCAHVESQIPCSATRSVSCKKPVGQRGGGHAGRGAGRTRRIPSPLGWKSVSYTDRDVPENPRFPGRPHPRVRPSRYSGVEMGLLISILAKAAHAACNQSKTVTGITQFPPKVCYSSEIKRRPNATVDFAPLSKGICADPISSM